MKSKEIKEMDMRNAVVAIKVNGGYEVCMRSGTADYYLVTLKNMKLVKEYCKKMFFRLIKD